MDRALLGDQDGLASGRRVKRLCTARVALVALATVTMVLASTSHAVAQGTPTAEELKARGNQAMMELNYAEALTAYRGALEKNPSDVALHYNIGRAHQARGDYIAASDALREFDQKAPAETKAQVPSLAQLITDIRAHVGEVSVACSMEVAKGTVIIGELARVEGCGASPKQVRVNLAAKSATVDVRLESEAFQAAPSKITIEGAASKPVDVLLSIGPKSNTGLLRVQAAPAIAVISVDGVPKGNSPVEVLIPGGSHVVEVTADGYEKAQAPFVLEVGGRKELNLTLEKTPPITKRWWFWAGAGAAVAGLTTVVVILIVQPEYGSSKGTIDPGVIRAPLVTF
jgi:hypothetical protein